ncbi:hypothetical protein ABZ172_05130 [Streptomyces sp. NPDC006296]
MSATTPPPRESSEDSVLTNLIWLQRTRQERLADARRLAEQPRQRRH